MPITCLHCGAGTFPLGRGLNSGLVKVNRYQYRHADIRVCAAVRYANRPGFFARVVARLRRIAARISR